MSLKMVMLLFFILHFSVISESKLILKVEEARPSKVALNSSWSFSRPFEEVEITWDAINYISEQVTTRTVGHTNTDSTSSSKLISGGLKLDQQYRICVTGSDVSCPMKEQLCSFVKISRSTKVQSGPHLYLVFGPVHSTNVTLSWDVVPKELMDSKLDLPRPDIGYRLEWRRVDGHIGGHPGHSSNVVSLTHVIKGLQPAMRYEICVGDLLGGRESETCDHITTAEDLPGPPIADESSCFNQARGTHWRCEVTWRSPKKPNGKVIGYTVSWRDQEGYTLLESVPRGILCDSFCSDSQVLTFHPQEVCIRARTSRGLGWESCVMITDISTRILAIFDSRLVYIVIATLFAYQFGIRSLKAILRCCVRSLHTHMEEKQHPV